MYLPHPITLCRGLRVGFYKAHSFLTGFIPTEATFVNDQNHEVIGDIMVLLIVLQIDKSKPFSGTGTCSMLCRCAEYF